MDNLTSFLLLSTLFLVVGATNNASSTINSYWNEVFPRTAMPNPIRALLPSSPWISGSSRSDRLIKRDPWSSRWGVFTQDHGLSKGNWSPNLAPLYFLREDLQHGSRMNVTLMIGPVIDGSRGGINLEPTFLPRQQAQEIPFSTSNLTAILEMSQCTPPTNPRSDSTKESCSK